MNVSSSAFFILSELQEDHSMEVMMRTKEMTVYERITSFYSAPFTKFMGNLVNALIFYKRFRIGGHQLQYSRSYTIVFDDTFAGVLHSVHITLRLRHHDVLPALWLVPDSRRTKCRGTHSLLLDLYNHRGGNQTGEWNERVTIWRHAMTSEKHHVI